MNSDSEVCGQVERAYPGYRVWVSDEGWWYASRVSPRALGRSPTVCGAGPEDLTLALQKDADEAATSPVSGVPLRCSGHEPARAVAWPQGGAGRFHQVSNGRKEAKGDLPDVRIARRQVR